MSLFLFRDRGVYKEGRLSYADFVWFLISEEDKKTDTRYLGTQTVSNISLSYYIAHSIYHTETKTLRHFNMP